MAVTAATSDGVVRFGNRRAAEMAGVEPDALIGIEARDIYVDPAERDAIARKLTYFRKTNSIKGEGVRQIKGGSFRSPF